MIFTVDLNADAGESFGRFELGNDEELFPYLTSVNIACGYHTSDPSTMRRTVCLAKEHGLKIGAHIAYPDLVGFGRRKMELSQSEVRDITIYQVGALMGFCKSEKVELSHVKAHGQLYLTAIWDESTARGIAEGVSSVSRDLALFFYGDIPKRACEDSGVRMVNESYVDLDFNPDGSIILERKKKSRDTDMVAELAVNVIKKGGREASDGSWIDLPAETICIHGDAPNAVEIVKAVRNKIEQSGIEIKAFQV